MIESMMIECFLYENIVKNSVVLFKTFVVQESYPTYGFIKVIYETS